MRIEFFEPPMCCSTGICGPSVDERLIRLQENIETLKSKYADLEIYRYMISQQPLKFRVNKEVYAIVQEQGRKALPITAFNRKVIKAGDYPSLEDLEKLIEESRNEKGED
jgi:hypothetical protein